TEKADKTDNKKNVQLSEKAKALLEELKKTYTNMDFYVADYETDEEADRYLAGLSGTKEYNVLIDVETLEAMAEDTEVRAQYENLMQDSVKKLEGMLEGRTFRRKVGNPQKTKKNRHPENNTLRESVIFYSDTLLFFPDEM
ncbi:MAG: hypothetical protein IIW10_04515, partial [Spirochaetaceae bacterium]|nr:hypothetical protein [Spirochaetaceae bacterium]